MTIIDVDGLSIGSLSKDTFAFLLAASYVMNNYYPERVKRICIVNAPFWFSGAWKVGPCTCFGSWLTSRH